MNQTQDPELTDPTTEDSLNLPTMTDLDELSQQLDQIEANFQDLNGSSE